LISFNVLGWSRGRVPWWVRHRISRERAPLLPMFAKSIGSIS
jgi:hypothetical protein